MNDTPKKLNLGCQNAVLPGFINIDNRQLPGVDVVADVTDLRMFETGTVDLIYACHILEHIPRAKTFITLLEWNRVLKRSGVLRLAVPDWDATVTAYQRYSDYENLLNWIYGSHEEEGNTHFRQFNFSGLKTILIEAGFKRVTRYDWRRTEHAQHQDYSSAVWPHGDYVNGIPMSLNIEAIKHIYPPDYYGKK